MNQRQVRRGEIYFADLNPVQGSEQGGDRPVLVIQNDIGNQYSPTTIVCVITKQVKNKMPTHVNLGKCGGLMKNSWALLEQIRTIDKNRLKDFVGRIEDVDKKKEIEKAMKISLGLG